MSSADVQTPPLTGAQCTECRASIEPSEGSYSDTGDFLCRTCSAVQAYKASNALVEDQDPTTTRNMYGAAAASGLLGLVTCTLSVFGIFGVIACPVAALLGGATLMRLLTNPDVRRELGGGSVLVGAGSLGGLLFGILGTVIGVLWILAAATA